MSDVTPVRTQLKNVTNATISIIPSTLLNHTNMLHDKSQVDAEIFSDHSAGESIDINSVSQYYDSDTFSSDDSMSNCDSQDEANSNPVRAVLVPSSIQGSSGDALRLEVDLSGVEAPPCVPLCVVTNPRSGWNKLNNIRTFLEQVGPDIMILSEHWGRKRSFQNALAAEHYKVLESSRAVKGIPTKGRNGKPAVSVTGGGVAILYTEENFIIEDANIEVPEGIEAVWLIMTPKNDNETVKKILVGGIYIAPCSQYK